MTGRKWKKAERWTRRGEADVASTWLGEAVAPTLGSAKLARTKIGPHRARRGGASRALRANQRAERVAGEPARQEEKPDPKLGLM
ncbi:hypothetical protein AXF42_Ash011258 [Apostasia shenzhenica]|uniref:Uncharacterized protein n=1 Tax=Apostasia shenzhenica TaxID=1088818 RepID=A0A2I0AL87_9ASPA|nr:hypothetical protein AXF42_Ash011258 [Apostasia shenzhenica]